MWIVPKQIYYNKQTNHNKAHILAVHKEEKPKNCSICDKGFGDWDQEYLASTWTTLLSKWVYQNILGKLMRKTILLTGNSTPLDILKQVGKYFISKHTLPVHEEEKP